MQLDAQATFEVKVSEDCASATAFWWDVFNTIKPMDVDFSTATEKPVLILNDIEDGGLL